MINRNYKIRKSYVNERQVQVSMKKSIEEKAKKLKSIFVTTNIFNEEQINNDSYKGCKYFILFYSTYKILDGFKTQKELEEKIDEILKEGV